MAGKGSPVKIFISYSAKDRQYKDEFVKQLEMLRGKKPWLEIYHDGKVPPSANLDQELRHNMANSQVVLFLLSADFVQSKYAVDVETRLAMDLRRHNRSIVVPILVKPTNFVALPFSRMQAIPKDDGPVAASKDRAAAWQQVIKELMPLFKGIHEGEIDLRRDSADDMLRMRNAKPFAKEIAEAKNQLADGDIDDAFKVLNKVSREVDQDLHLRIVLLSAQYRSWDTSVERGILKTNEIPVLREGITNKLLGLIEEMNIPDKYGPIARV